jgi:RND family efflux transporter MFP subunit
VGLALTLLVTVGAAWLWAHEGHQALPARGVVVDAEKGLLIVSAESRAALDVQTVQVSQRTLEDRLTAPAVLVAPWQGHAFVTAPVGGKVANLTVQPGETVTKGQLLAEAQSLELENLQLELVNAQNAARLTEENLKGLEAGNRQGVISDQQLREYQAKHQANRNALELARRKLLSLGVAEDALDRLLHADTPSLLKTLPIRSPLSGVVLHVDARVGQVVEPTDHLFEIVDLSTVWAQIAVLEKDLDGITVGQPVEIRLTAYPEADAVFHSTVQVKSLALDPKTHQGTVWAEVSNPKGQPPRALPGMIGQAQLIRPRKQATLTVPTNALIRDGAEAYVLVEQGPGQYVRRNVVVGKSTPEFVEVRSSQLYPPDWVVTVGSHQLATFFVQGVLQLSPEAAENMGLKFEIPQRRQVAEVVSLSGTVELPPGRQAVVSSRLPGTIHRILVDRSQAVSAGEVVAEVASLELQNLQLELLRNHLELGVLEQTLKALPTSTSPDAIPARQRREIESAATTARQRRDDLRRKLEAVGLSPEQVKSLVEKQEFAATLPVRAPINGAVVRFQAVLGQAVKPEDPLFEIQDPSSARFRAFVTERQLPRVRIGQTARLRLLANPDFQTEATVVRSDPVFSANDRTLSLWAEPNQPLPPAWLPGMLTRQVVVVALSEPTLAVPVDAVLSEGTRTYLFVRKDRNAPLERRLVATGRRDDRFVEITQGLQEGKEEVAVRGVSGLQTAYASLK